MEYIGNKKRENQRKNYRTTETPINEITISKKRTEEYEITENARRLIIGYSPVNIQQSQGNSLYINLNELRTPNQTLFQNGSLLGKSPYLA